MKKSGKIAMIAASGMVFAGIVISLCAMCAMGFDFSKMETATFRTETHPVEQSFSRICVEGAGSDVRLYLSDDDSCRVQCHEREGLESIIEIKDDTLYIRQRTTAHGSSISAYLLNMMKSESICRKAAISPLRQACTAGISWCRRNFAFRKPTYKAPAEELNCMHQWKVTCFCARTAGT